MLAERYLQRPCSSYQKRNRNKHSYVLPPKLQTNKYFQTIDMVVVCLRTEVTAARVLQMYPFEGYEDKTNQILRPLAGKLMYLACRNVLPDRIHLQYTCCRHFVRSQPPPITKIQNKVFVIVSSIYYGIH